MRQNVSVVRASNHYEQNSDEIRATYARSISGSDFTVLQVGYTIVYTLRIC